MHITSAVKIKIALKFFLEFALISLASTNKG